MGEGHGLLDPRGVVHLNRGWRQVRPTAGQKAARDPVAALPSDPLAALVRHNERRGAKPDPYTAGARWKRERDIPDEIRFRATEAAL